MKTDKDEWRDIANVINAGFKDLLESMLVCFIVFIFFAFLGFIGRIELYANIIKRVAGAVIITTLGIRMTNEIKNYWFTISIYILSAVNNATAVILIIIDILSYFSHF